MTTPDPASRFEPIDVPRRYPTREVAIGDLRVGGANPILIQSMTIADTMDTDGVVGEIRALVDAGCPLVRLTAPSQRDAENLREIRKRLHADGIRVPMVADIHFTPNAAMVAAEIVEKVRINPGNYADRKKFKVFEISDAAYAEELERIRDRVVPLVRRCKENGVALRIGTNHGSLSDRIMNRYGDTPEGMVESALEFVRICRDEGFHDIVLSMKSSIPTVMIAAYRLLVQQMDREGMNYPLHLGVTEAGNGLEGRTKSAVGIGSLLASGMGDTIRVSLTEDSEHEIAACRNILQGIEGETRLPDPAPDVPPATPPVTPATPATPPDHATAGATRARGASPTRVWWRPADSWRTLPPVAWATRRRTAPWVLAGGRAATSPGSDAAVTVTPGERAADTVALGGDAPVRVELRAALDAPPDVAAMHRRDRERLPEFLSVEIPTEVVTGGAMSAAGLDRLRERLERIREETGLPVLAEWPTLKPEASRTRVRMLPDPTVIEGLARSAGALGLPAPDPGSGLGGGLDGGGDGGHEGGLDGGRDDLDEVLGALARSGCPVRWRLAPSVPVGLAPVLAARTRDAGVPGVGFVLDVGPATIARGRALSDALRGDDALVFLEAPASGSTGAMVAGTLLTEGIGDAVCLTDRPAGGAPGAAPAVAPPWPAGGVPWDDDPVAASYLLLQACRIRLTRAEFIACPSCGRTQFDLQTTTARIRARTEHLSGVKIAIMGCIVNGPGEMADADFGYVGSGSGRVDLYVGRERVEKNIPAADAEDRLVALLAEHGVWKEPEAAASSPGE